MRIDLGMIALYGLIIGVGVWIWRLMSGISTPTSSDSNTVVLTDPTPTASQGEATTWLGEQVDAIQEVTGSSGVVGTMVDVFQGWFR